MTNSDIIHDDETSHDNHSYTLQTIESSVKKRMRLN